MTRAARRHLIARVEDPANWSFRSMWPSTPQAKRMRALRKLLRESVKTVRLILEVSR